ncbi:P-loop containing nucleoside triphosphate hydrolase protein [Trametes elegans]|nr:P-loop containing nucleoside triphosphate hydrolase protein [Trametes elegans]
MLSTDTAPASVSRVHDPAPSLGDTAADPYSRWEPKQLQSFVDICRSIGAQSDINLPRVAVIGNQSAGKSSLVEGISGITVPRDAGTCTRCPIELRLSRSDAPWSSRVSLHWEYDPSGKPLPHVTEVPFGDPFTDKGDIELWLRRAQAAILSHHQKHNPADFLDKDGEDLAELARRAVNKFSRNVVCVSISGPDLPDLSFIDLPGLIQNENSDGDIRLVEELAKSYISSSSTIILVVMPMTDDIQNQKAAQLAREYDATGTRTIGVLTKPDALPVGALGAQRGWLDVLERRAHQTEHGYFCTRQPDDAERKQKITPAQARAAEDAFFATQMPWAASSHRDRFGTHNLTQCISELLTGRIRTSLPDVERKVTTQRTDVIRELASLPPEIADAQAQAFTLVGAFSADVGQVVEGSPTHTTLVHANKQSYAALAATIFATSPPFVPHLAAHGLFGKVPDLASLNLYGQKPLYLDTVRQRIQASVTRELPNNVPYAVKRAFIHDFQRTWEEHALRCVDQVEGAFRRVLGELIERHFGRFQTMKRAVRMVVFELLEEHSTTTKRQVGYLLKYESNPPSTQNGRDFADGRLKYLEIYKTARTQTIEGSTAAKQPADSQQSKPFQFGKAPSIFNIGSAGQSAPSASRTTFPRSNASHAKPEPIAQATGQPDSADPDIPHASEGGAPDDGYEDELELMAEVRAFFDISSKRTVDNIPAAVDEHMLHAYARALQDALVARLGLTAPDARARCARLLAEDACVAARRADLRAKQARLDGVQKALREFGSE